MSVLSALTEAMRSATVEVVDLTAPLSASTPVIKLPEPFGNTVTFALHEISRYDDRGPAWYWNDITTGEHTGTHFDAPVHWVTGRDGEDVSQVPAARLIAPAVVLDFSAQAAADPDFLLEVDHIKEWEGAERRAARGRLAALPYRLGRPLGRPAAVPERERDGPAHARGLGGVRPVAGRGGPGDRASGWRPSAPMPGAAHSFDPPFPCHSALLGAGKYGLTQLQNLAALPRRRAWC